MPHALIVDDNSVNVQVLETLLAKQGVTSTRVLDPVKLAATVADLGHLDVVFLDLEMPHLTGYEVMARLKADTRFDGIPVVAYTVHMSQIQEAHSAGFHSFIPKPIDPKRFPDQLERILSGEPVWERV
jgi:two-component system cell cycle response regulator DivK